MATHTVAAGEVGTAAFTLTADVVDTVTFTGTDANDVEVISDGAAAIWYTLDGSTPAANGAACYYVPAVASVDSRSPRTSGATVVKLISSGTPVVRVQRGDL
jgi:hypothetical protein